MGLVEILGPEASPRMSVLVFDEPTNHLGIAFELSGELRRLTGSAA